MTISVKFVRCTIEDTQSPLPTKSLDYLQCMHFLNLAQGFRTLYTRKPRLRINATYEVHTKLVTVLQTKFWIWSGEVLLGWMYFVFLLDLWWSASILDFCYCVMFAEVKKTRCCKQNGNLCFEARKMRQIDVRFISGGSSLSRFVLSTCI